MLHIFSKLLKRKPIAIVYSYRIAKIKGMKKNILKKKLLLIMAIVIMIIIKMTTLIMTRMMIVVAMLKMKKAKMRMVALMRFPCPSCQKILRVHWTARNLIFLK